jgi:chloramphenicol-sensitive protein RarD
MPPSRLAGFALVWAALLVLSVDGLTHHRRSRRDAGVLEPAGAAPL